LTALCEEFLELKDEYDLKTLRLETRYERLREDEAYA